jgi:hypothetical protein
LIGWLLGLWRAYQRAIDLQLLWPVCKREALAQCDDPDMALQWARVAFATHAMADPAWRCLSAVEVIDRIDRLE